MTEHPAALQLRLLQTVVEVAAEKNSTLVLPFPVELLRFLERATPPDTADPVGRAISPPQESSSHGMGALNGAQDQPPSPGATARISAATSRSPV